MPGQEGEVGLAVFVVKEEIAPKVAALRDGLRAAHGHHASNACHRKDSGSMGGKFSGKRLPNLWELSIDAEPMEGS